MDRFKIAFVTPEAIPFVKTGGLADVSGVLPSIISSMGHDTKMFLPLYRQVREKHDKMLERLSEFEIKVGDDIYSGALFMLRKGYKGSDVYFIGQSQLFDRPGLYSNPFDGEDYPDNAERFIFFSKAVIESIRGLDWNPDIIHLNDWQSALVAPYIKILHPAEPNFKDARLLFTIHNLAFQGQFEADVYPKLGIPDSYFASAGPFEYWGKVNFMKSALFFADHITTVSPTYAREITASNEYGMGLEGVLSERADRLTGILNGVDYSSWSPKVDKLIPFRYFPANLSGKKKNKLALVQKAGFPVRMDSPLFGMISRLDSQKGLDLIMEIFDRMMTLDLQFILLGTGAEKYMQFFRGKEPEYRNKFKTYLNFDNVMAHWIEAGADIFLMPSRYEPGGLNQMYSLKYGTVPLVRKTGGLADSVEDFNSDTKTGTGLVFENYDAEKLLEAIKRGTDLFRRKRLWYKLMKAGMAQDFSWERSARQYLALYERLVSEVKN